jgi:hypothetical protein
VFTAAAIVTKVMTTVTKSTKITKCFTLNRSRNNTLCYQAAVHHNLIARGANIVNFSRKVCRTTLTTNKFVIIILPKSRNDSIFDSFCGSLFNIKVKVEGQRIVVPCVVEGKGTNLFGYGFYTSRRVNIPLSELNHEVVEVPVINEQGVVDTLAKAYKVRISPLSMQDAISVRFSDLKIVSVGDFDDIAIPQR